MLMSLPDHREVRSLLFTYKCPHLCMQRAVAMLKELLVAKKGLNGELSAEVEL